MLSLILEVFAFVFFCFAAAGIGQWGRVHLLALGLACWILAIILGGTNLHALFR